MFVSIEHKGRVREILSGPRSLNMLVPVYHRCVRGSRILGLGDLGANGNISIEKLDLYHRRRRIEALVRGTHLSGPRRRRRTPNEASRSRA